jgi:hypothetical protein
MSNRAPVVPVGVAGVAGTVPLTACSAAEAPPGRIRIKVSRYRLFAGALELLLCTDAPYKSIQGRAAM